MASFLNLKTEERSSVSSSSNQEKESQVSYKYFEYPSSNFKKSRNAVKKSE